MYGDTGYKEKVETYEIHKDIPAFKDVKIHPFLQAYWDEIAPFHRKMHDNIINPLSVLLSIILELPEDFFSGVTAYENQSQDRVRWMLRPSATMDYYEKTQPFQIGSHVDFSYLTVLFEQTVSGLQLLTKDGTYKHVPFAPGCVTINAAETIELITKGYVKGTKHRVMPPPADQLELDRLGIIYFATFNHDLVLRPVPSPKLKRLGLVTDDEINRDDYPTASEWQMARMKKVHHIKEYPKRDDKAVFELKGMTVKSYFD